MYTPKFGGIDTLMKKEAGEKGSRCANELLYEGKQIIKSNIKGTYETVGHNKPKFGINKM